GPGPLPPPDGFMPGGGTSPAETTMPLTLNWGAAAPPAPTRRPVRPESAQPSDFVQPRFTPTRTPPAELERELERAAVRPEPRAGRHAPPETATSRRSLISSSAGMAVGTLVSRITGFLRTVVFAYALGVGGLGNAYNNANTL